MVVELRPGDFPEYAERGEFEMADAKVDAIEMQIFEVGMDTKTIFQYRAL